MIGTAVFGKNTTYKELGQPFFVRSTTNGDGPYDSERLGLRSEGNQIIMEVPKDQASGTYVIGVKPKVEEGVYSDYATIEVMVVRSIDEIQLKDVPVEIYKPAGTAVTFKVNARCFALGNQGYTYQPKTSKVDWSVHDP